MQSEWIEWSTSARGDHRCILLRVYVCVTVSVRRFYSVNEDIEITLEITRAVHMIHTHNILTTSAGSMHFGSMIKATVIIQNCKKACSRCGRSQRTIRARTSF